MILSTRGRPRNIVDYIVAPVTRDPTSCENKILIDENNSYSTIDTGSLCHLTLVKEIEPPEHKIIFKIPRLDHLSEGDIAAITSDGVINTIYRLDSKHNTLLATERCNSNCLMCSQPPRDRDDIDAAFAINSLSIPLIPKSCQELGISGGEPTLMGNKFFQLLSQISVDLPNTEVHVLTNGRSFAWYEFAEKLTTIDTSRVTFGIPLYCDDYAVHDYIVQAKDAFNQTILGIYNLARLQKRIEIRIVLHKLTIPRLKKLAEYIFKNLPFVDHVAFMGLEYIGYTPYNIDKLWIDPYDYRNNLAEATEFLAGHGLNVSIYNTPLCLLHEFSWRFARKSISDWKNTYAEECSGCLKKEDCGGFFTWNLKKRSDHIKAII